MRAHPIKLYVYKGRDNIATLSIVERDTDGTETAVDWSAVTRMVLVLLSSTPVTIDTQSAPANTIDYSVTGKVGFRLGEIADVEALTEGEYYARLTAWDSAGDDTEILHEDHPETPVIFSIRDTSA